MSADKSFGLTDKEVLNDLEVTLHSCLLDILVYGIYTVVYFVALYLTLSREDNKPRVGSAVLITIMWILVTIHASISWVILDNIYIQHGKTRETQLGASFSLQSGELFPVVATNYIVSFFSISLADMTMIWRCWVLFSRRRFIVMIPALSFAAVSVCYVWQAIHSLALKPAIWADNQSVNLELLYLSATVITNIFCTTAIICRIVAVSGWKSSFKTYRGLLEIMIESSILYTAIYTTRIGLNIHTQYITEELDESALFSEALGFSITGLAPTLIIARVAAGLARPDDSWTHTSLPHMRSTMRSLAESLHFARPATGTVTDNVDLERSIGSEASAALDAGDERPKSTTGGGQTEPGEAAKDV